MRGRWTDRYIDVRAELCQAKHAVELKQTAAREAAAKKAGERAVREAAARAEQAEAALDSYSTPRASSSASEACMTQAAAFDRAHALLRSAPWRTGNPWTLCATQYVLEPCVSDAVFYELLVCMGVRE